MRKNFRKAAALTLIISLAVPTGAFAYSGEQSESGRAATNEAVIEHAPGELIVTFAEDTSRKKENLILKDAIEEAVEKNDSVDTENVQTTDIDSDTVLLKAGEPSDISEEALIEELENNPAVENVQPNYYYTIDSSSGAGFETGISRYNAWYMDYLDVPEAWAAIEKYRKDGTIANPSKRVVIATLDSGICLKHEDEKNIGNGGNFDLAHCKTTVAGIDPDSTEYNPSKGSIAEYPNPNISHGNSTSSVIGATAGNGRGIAGIAAGYNNNISSVMAINVFRRNINSEHKATSADIIAGIDYACRHNAQVIMMCLGHSPGGPDGNGGKINDKALEEKINWATREEDVVFVASAGNSNNTSTWYPSDFDACISAINTVKYTNIDSRNCKNPDSSYGPKKDISAPGTGIMHCTMSPSGYAAGTGTSYAAPIVASIAGLVRYVNPSLNQQEVKDILYSTATDLYTPGYDIYTGHGNVNAYAAVTAAVGKPDKIVPKKLAATKVYAESAGKSSIKLAWKNVGAGRYSIYRAANPNSGFSYIKAVTGTSCTDTGLVFNKNYYYKVIPRGTSKDGKRIDGNISNVVGARAICGKPYISVKAKGKHSARIYWNKANDASGYQIYQAKSPNGNFKRIGTVNRSGNGYRNMKNLKSKQTYYYKVRAYTKKDGKIYYGTFSSVKACKQR